MRKVAQQISLSLVKKITSDDKLINEDVDELIKQLTHSFGSQTFDDQTSNEQAVNEPGIDKLDIDEQDGDNQAIDRVIELFKNKILRLEKNIWPNPVDSKQTKVSVFEDASTEDVSLSEENIQQYQSAFRALEKLHDLKPSDNRYHFKVIIPVADRPQHLKQCLSSLLTLCKSYQYGGYGSNDKHGKKPDNKFTKISVLIADDSQDKNNILLHKNYCTEFTSRGLSTEYFGLEEQIELTRKHIAQENTLSPVIGDVTTIKTSSDFSHKGASVMRNITYLKLNDDLKKNRICNKTLLYFIDSDQEFCINSTYDSISGGSSNNGTNSSKSAKNNYAINYFHYLNEIFSTKDITVLTGKVVGDPPVSPSVMAGNFQQDIKTFLNTIARMSAHGSCQFHQHQEPNSDDAAYHDMANLFGFSSQEHEFNYHCSLSEEHNNADCFYDFSEKLQHFFYGEHPTRKTFFNYEQGFSNTAAARTVYTGNYVIKPEALKYFIPFASLKLRMAGPVLGRILKSEIDQQFVSANLPMLHNRTVQSIGKSEFRSGVENQDNNIDLGNEFIRQFYGDVMLFTIELLADEGYPEKRVDDDFIQSTLQQTYERIKENYIEKHHTVLDLRNRITELLDDKTLWWNKKTSANSKIAIGLTNFKHFLDNIKSNFSNSSFAYQQITIGANAQKQLHQIYAAIINYDDETAHWKKALSAKLSPGELPHKHQSPPR